MIHKMLNKSPVILVILGIFIILCLGCEEFIENGNEYLIRVGHHEVTVSDFHKAFEVAKAAYPHNALQKPGVYKKAQVRLLNQMTEELILLERAKELNISVTDQELKKAVDRVKGDYPDDVFEETLLEYAVTYQAWKKGLRTRMLMEKVVARELGDRIVIDPDDVARYYKESYQKNQLNSDITKSSKDINEKIVEHLRRQKTEAAYKQWVEKIQKRYTIEINKIQWEKIISS